MTDARTLTTTATASTPTRHPLAGAERGLLTQAVRVGTGIPDAMPRKGQAALYDHIKRAIDGHKHMAGEAPTGSGKSFAALSAAFEAFIERTERTIISTDSLSLMGQLQDKDVPTMLRAARDLYPDVDISVAFLKGVSNYVDPAKVLATGQALTGTNTFLHSKLADELEKAGTLHAGADRFPGVEDFEQLRKLVVWALRTYRTDNDPGDRHSCPIDHDNAMWAAVSSSSAEADDGTRFGLTAKVQLAREAAERADIIVTNHSILAIQAAKDVPVIVNSARLGLFDHIIVDEAHTLPSHVRNQGSDKLSGGTLTRLGRQVARAADNSTSAVLWRNEGEHIADLLDDTLASFARGGDNGTRRLTKDDHPLDEIALAIEQWLKRGSKSILGKPGDHRNVDAKIKADAARDAIDNALAALGSLQRHRAGWARWVDQDHVPEEAARQGRRAWWQANVSPIDVGWLLRDNLWSFEQDVTTEAEDGLNDTTVQRFELSVSAISATMPGNFPHQAGLNAQLMKFPTPFAQAYKESALFIPMMLGSELSKVSSPGYGNKPRFDVAKHEKWAAEAIAQLVGANDGRAMVLAATARGGKVYADMLRRRLPRHIRVLSQWDGGSSARIVGEWRDDVHSVLVGTKSYMTGVDLSGIGNELVVLDRVPRSPSNPLDDARVEELTARIGDRWAADRAVYSVDAALLMSQAIGRLIRATSDRGMVAILDPRLLKPMRGADAVTYPEQTRAIYRDTYIHFGEKMTNMQAAVAWLEKSAQRVKQAA